MSYLQNFLFNPDQARAPIRTLSGGEQNRLLLAKLFALPTNFLVLDEPTNDLDIETLELLEELLIEYTAQCYWLVMTEPLWTMLFPAFLCSRVKGRSRSTWAVIPIG